MYPAQHGKPTDRNWLGAVKITSKLALGSPLTNLTHNAALRHIHRHATQQGNGKAEGDAAANQGLGETANSPSTLPSLHTPSLGAA